LEKPTKMRIDPEHHTAHMAVYVKPTGRLTRAYMALIAPCRWWIVYPALIRTVARVWDEPRVDPDD